MKIKMCVGLLLSQIVLTSAFAGEAEDMSGDASGMSAGAALSAVAAPILLSAGVVTLGIAGTEGLSELTYDVLDESFEDSNAVTYQNVPKAKISVNGKVKTIPLVVREDHLEFNDTAKDY